MFKLNTLNLNRTRIFTGFSLLLLTCTPFNAFAKSKQKALPANNASTKVYEAAKAKLSQELYPAYRILDRLMSANPAIKQNTSIAVRSLDEQTCKQLIGENALCAIAANLPNVSKEDNLMIWALQVAAAQTPDLNAYATSANNKIVINRALYDALANNI